MAVAWRNPEVPSSVPPSWWPQRRRVNVELYPSLAGQSLTIILSDETEVILSHAGDGWEVSWCSPFLGQDENQFDNTILLSTEGLLAAFGDDTIAGPAVRQAGVVWAHDHFVRIGRFLDLLGDHCVGDSSNAFIYLSFEVVMAVRKLVLGYKPIPVRDLSKQHQAVEVAESSTDVLDSNVVLFPTPLAA